MKDKISLSAKIYPDVALGENIIIGDFSIIGKPYRLVFGEEYPAKYKTKVEKDCQLGSHVILYKGTNIGEKTDIEDFTKIEQDVKIDKNCHIIYGSQICNEATIGKNCIMAGFICERAVIGNNCRIFGKLIHNQHNPLSSWDETVESSPFIGDNVFIGFDAKIIGGITINHHAYVCSNAIITKNVPSYHIAYDVNKIIHYKKWKGPLAESKFFKLK